MITELKDISMVNDTIESATDYERSSQTIVDKDDIVARAIRIDKEAGEKESCPISSRYAGAACMSKEMNNQLNPDEPGRVRTSTNYQPYGNYVGIDIIIKATIMDIVTSPEYATLIGKVKGDVFKTGRLNPELRVFGYGHLVQGINIGDYIDLNAVPDIVSVRGIILDGNDYNAVHDYYRKRNPRAAISAHAKGVYGTQHLAGKEADLDDINQEVIIVQRAIVEAYNIVGVYCHPEVLKEDRYK